LGQLQTVTQASLSMERLLMISPFPLESPYNIPKKGERCGLDKSLATHEAISVFVLYPQGSTCFQIQPGPLMIVGGIRQSS